MAPTASSSALSIGVQDVLSDIDALTSEAAGGGRSALLSYGHSWLPDDLRAQSIDTDAEGQRGAPPTDLAHDAAELEETLALVTQAAPSDEAQRDDAQRKRAAVRLTQVYIRLAQNVLRADDAQRNGPPVNGQQEAASGHFEQLHRRVAQLQAHTESERQRLEQVLGSIESAIA